MFGEEASTNATIRLHNHIWRLRKRLGASAVVTLPRGYRLDTDVVELDWLRFESLLAAAAATAEPAGAAGLLEEALALWRGEPFADVEEWEPARALAARLEELRRVAEEDHAAALIAAGRSARAASVLETLAMQEPLRERRWSLLMLALYRCARQADALRTYQRACDTLAEIGLDPGPDLHHLERAISVHDDALGIDPMPSTTAMTAPTIAPTVDDGELESTPRSNLPSPADSFVGRQRELIQLAEALTRTGWSPSSVWAGWGRRAWPSRPPPAPTGVRRRELVGRSRGGPCRYGRGPDRGRRDRGPVRARRSHVGCHWPSGAAVSTR